VSRSDELRFSEFFGTPASELGSVMGDENSRMTYYLSLPAKIDNRDVDARGKRISEVRDMSRLRRLNSLTIASDAKRKNLTRAANEIQRIGASLGAGKNAVERAYEIYRKGIEEGIGRRRSIVGMAEAAVYLACNEGGIPRSVHEIQHVAGGHEEKNIMHYTKVLSKGTGVNAFSPDPAAQISRMASRARLRGVTERRAIQILQKVKHDPTLAGKRPASIAAAALYLAANETTESTTQIRIAYSAGITTITLRRRVSEVSKLLESSDSRQVETSSNTA